MSLCWITSLRLVLFPVVTPRWSQFPPCWDYQTSSNFAFSAALHCCLSSGAFSSMWVRFYETKLHCRGWLNPLRPADAVHMSLMDKTIHKFTDDVRVISGGDQTAYRSELKGSIATISLRRRSWTWADMIRESEVKLVSSLHICDDLTRGDWGSLERLRGHSFIIQSIRTSRTSYLCSRTSRMKDRFSPQAKRLTTRFNPLYHQTLMCNLSW